MRNTHTPKNRGRASASLGPAVADLKDVFACFNAPGIEPDNRGEALRFIDPLQISPDLLAHIASRKAADDDQDAADEAYHRLKAEFFMRREWSMEADREFSAQPKVAALSKRSDAAVERSDACLLAAMRTPCLGLGDLAAKLSVAKLWLNDDDQGELYAKENQAFLASMLPLFDVGGAEAPACAAVSQDSADEDGASALSLDDDVYDQVRSVKAMMFFLVRNLQDTILSAETDQIRESIDACHTVGRHCFEMLDAILERIDEGAEDGRQTEEHPRSEVRNVW